MSGNNADKGGGILNNSGTVTITGSTISGNFASDKGGGILHTGTTMTLTNSTVSGNTADGVNADDGGGGILVRQPITLNNVTVANNTAALDGGGIFNSGGGATTTLSNTIIANNTGEDCVADVNAIVSSGNNLDSDNTCGLGSGDHPGVDPLLGALAGNGGATQTHALGAGSPAIDAIAAGCPPPATDQRGITRPQDGDSDGSAACDIGAYEFQVPATPTPAPGTPTLAPATATPAALPPTGDGSGDGGSVSTTWLVVGAIAALGAATVGLRVTRARG